MDIKIQKSKLKGNIIAPPSKSYAIRAIIAAALCDGKNEIKNIEYSDDVKATIECVKQLGAKVKQCKNSLVIEGINLSEHSYNKNNNNLYKEKVNNKNLNKTNKTKKQIYIFNCNESATLLRILIPICINLKIKATFIGKGQLFQRPLNVYENIFKKKNIKYNLTNKKLTIDATKQNENKKTKKGNIQKYKIPGNISSQFVSGLLYASAVSDKDTEIEVLEPIESKGYIDMTKYILKFFGLKIKTTNNKNIIKNEHDNNTRHNCKKKKSTIFYIKGKQKLKETKYIVEGDYSNAAYFDAMNDFSNINIKGLKANSLQADKKYKKYFAQIKRNSPTIDLKNNIDLAPVLFVYSAIHNGAHFINTKRLKLKETDRIKCMAQELKKYNVKTEVYDNEIIIHKIDSNKNYLDTKLKRKINDKKNINNNTKTNHIIINPHNDHRIAMAFTVLGLNYGNIVIKNAQCVNKSFNSFYNKIYQLGGNIIKQYNKQNK